MSEYFDAGAACVFLHISHDALLQLIQTGKFPGHRLAHGGWTVPKDDCVEYLHKSQQKGPQSHGRHD